MNHGIATITSSNNRGNLRRRRIFNWLALGATLLATAIGLLALGAILWTLLSRGFAGWSLKVFTETTPAPGSSGGLLNAIYGSALMTLLGVGMGTPVGMLAGTYLSEYSGGSRFATVVRFINDVLLSAPSILIGLFVYTVVVVQMGHFSALAGAIALSIIAIPVAVRTTEDMMRLVPKSIRDGSAAMGAQPWRTITSIVYPAARSGLITGGLLAVARISGETAPLVFTAFGNQFWSINLNGPMSSLPSVIFQFAMTPYKDWQELAWTGALIITLFVLVLSIAARAMSALFGGSRNRSE
ncbi:MAG TPA: phosphate ABC transporter permease PstA [Steroidobacteraceae bacterium]|nr:phosphate ABC transporter permease PstA [Steroidobacteraceae bacterium]